MRVIEAPMLPESLRGTTRKERGAIAAVREHDASHAALDELAAESQRLKLYHDAKGRDA
jgi:hypothetical protein